MKLIVTDAKTVLGTDLSLDGFDRFGSVRIFDRFDLQKDRAALAEAELLLCNKTVIDRAFLAAAPRLRYIGLFATGYNNIDLTETKRRGITVCNAGAYSTAAVVQHVFALILAHTSRVAEYDDFVRTGGWKNSPVFSPFVYPTAELSGKTLGIVGYGSIGKGVAAVAKAFGMRVLVHTRTIRPEAKEEFVTLPELLSAADVITLHCPLTAQTEKMIGAKELRRCKKTAFLINTARGGLVDENALAAALKSRALAGAGIDVLTTEPMAADCPLTGIESCIITPHVAWAPRETRARLLAIVADNLQAFLDGKPAHVVGA